MIGLKLNGSNRITPYNWLTGTKWASSYNTHFGFLSYSSTSVNLSIHKHNNVFKPKIILKTINVL